MTLAGLDDRPVLVAVAGPDGAGKTTFCQAHLRASGLLFVNADALARELDLGVYEAARVADSLRRELVRQRASFVFETVFSDPVGDKVNFLKGAAATGYSVVLLFVGIPDSDVSVERVSMRVSQRGHDVPDEKLHARLPRILANLRRAIRELPRVIVYDNGDLRRPFRCVAMYEAGQLVESASPLPEWLSSILP